MGDVFITTPTQWLLILEEHPIFSGATRGSIIRTNATLTPFVQENPRFAQFFSEPAEAAKAWDKINAKPPKVEKTEGAK